MSYIYTLSEAPVPVNNMYLNVPGRGRVKTKRYKAWRMASSWELVEQRRAYGVNAITERVSVTVHLPEKTRGDADGRLKATLDCLQDAGIISNDRLCDPVSIGRAEVEQTTIIIELRA